MPAQAAAVMVKVTATVTHSIRSHNSPVANQVAEGAMGTQQKVLAATVTREEATMRPTLTVEATTAVTRTTAILTQATVEAHRQEKACHLQVFPPEHA